MGTGQSESFFGRRQAGLSFLDRFGARPGQQQFQLSLGRLLLQLRLNEHLLGLIDLSCRNLLACPQRP